MQTLQTTKTSFGSEMVPSLRLHKWLGLISTVYFLAAILVSKWLDAPFDAHKLLLESSTGTALGLVFLLCARAIFVMVFIRPTRLTLFLLNDFKNYTTRERLIFALPVLVLISIFISGFSLFKAAIPFIHPYSLDFQISKWDMLLHGGQHPWQLLQPIIGFPLITAVINIFYHLWFFVMFAFLYWQACSMVDPRLRNQFLWSFLMIWIVLGTIGATSLSSVGPCYYGNFVAGDNPFAPLMQYLRNVSEDFPIWALHVQDLLLTDYLNRNTHTALGISAMPSLHVATSVLMALAGWRIHRVAGIALTLFAFIIMVGSVHLGWHYAIDGYVGAIGAFVIWHLAGWLLSSSHQSSGAQSNLTPDRPEFAWPLLARMKNTP